MNPVILLACAVLLHTVVRGDDYCFLDSTNVRVRASDCPHGCCVDDECGSRSECRAAWVVVVIVVCSVICCGVIAGALLFSWCTKQGPFKETAVFSETTFPVQTQPAYHQTQQAGSTGPEPVYEAAYAHPQHQQQSNAPDNYIPGYPAPPPRS